MSYVTRIKLSDGNISFYYRKRLIFSEQKGIELFSKILRTVTELEYDTRQKDHLIYVSQRTYCRAHASIRKGQIILEYNTYTFVFSKRDLIISKDNIVAFLNKEYAKGDLDFSNIDYRFFEEILGIDIPYIEDAVVERVRLADLKCFATEDNSEVHLKDGEFYMQLKNEEFNNIPSHKNNNYLNTNKDQLKRILLLVDNNGYFDSGELIVLYNDDNIIRDGVNRASAMLFLYGNIEIPILRIYFNKNFYSYSLFYKKDQSK